MEAQAIPETHGCEGSNPRERLRYVAGVPMLGG
jgi:hypothetical protein